MVLDQPTTREVALPKDMIFAFGMRRGLFLDFPPSILSYLPGDLGTYSIYGLRSAELRRRFKRCMSLTPLIL